MMDGWVSGSFGEALGRGGLVLYLCRTYRSVQAGYVEAIRNEKETHRLSS